MKPTEQEYQDYFKDLDAFIKSWKENKKCKCDNPECCHYSRYFNKSEFRVRTDDLFNRGLLSNAISFCKFAKQELGEQYG